ncbi:sigma-70 family RNA polymerase sigma factor [Fodinicola feengrottensis]|uniref:Sigma-70 family RNA polymerase sigma factor n=1 Tax=Fodinicola feengrottensis TaxID=435914 RepID=A0ABP4SJJ2_9ACTN|nr:RNA polymerase sigma factor [Fodinicola feengrottensis]
MASTDPATAGDPRMVLEQLYRAAAPRLVVAAYAFTGDLGEAQECMQEAFVRAYAHPGRILQTENPVGWMRIVTVNIARDRMRRKRRFAVLHRLLATTPDPVPAATPDRVAILTAIRVLPAGQRETVALHYLLDLAVDEIAELTSVSVNTAKSRLRRGRAALSVLLSEESVSMTEARND